MNHTNETTSPEPLLLDVPTAAARLGISKWTLYDLMHGGILPSVKIRSRRFIAATDLDEYVRSLRAEAEVRHGL
jgi:excisionase family DNA binding protein